MITQFFSSAVFIILFLCKFKLTKLQMWENCDFWRKNYENLGIKVIFKKSHKNDQLWFNESHVLNRHCLPVMAT